MLLVTILLQLVRMRPQLKYLTSQTCTEVSAVIQFKFCPSSTRTLTCFDQPLVGSKGHLTAQYASHSLAFCLRSALLLFGEYTFKEICAKMNKSSKQAAYFNTKRMTFWELHQHQHGKIHIVFLETSNCIQITLLQKLFTQY